MGGGQASDLYLIFQPFNHSSDPARCKLPCSQCRWIWKMTGWLCWLIASLGPYDALFSLTHPHRGDAVAWVTSLLYVTPTNLLAHQAEIQWYFFFGLTMSHLGRRQVSMRIPRKIHPVVATTSTHHNDPKYFSPAPASWNIFLYCFLSLWLSFLHFHFPSSKGVTRTQVDSLFLLFFGFSTTASHILII